MVRSRGFLTAILVAALLFAAVLPPLSLAICAILSFSLLVYAAAAPLRVVAVPCDEQRAALRAVARLRAPPARF